MRGIGLSMMLLVAIPFSVHAYHNYYTDPNYQSIYHSTYRSAYHSTYHTSSHSYKHKTVNAAARLPKSISGYGENVVIVDPRVHAWGAYTSDGKLIRSGLATAGSGWCPDIRRSCRTKSGSFRIASLGSASCKSSKYPLPRGGAPMPYCMFFNGRQGLHGSYNVVDGNVSHGCVRLHVDDAKWLRFNFVKIGTKVIVRSY